MTKEVLAIILKNRKKNGAGFTLVEVLVVIFIMMLISGIMIANYHQFGAQFALQRSANKLALDIRRAEEMAMSAKEFHGMVPPGGYGVYIKLEGLPGEEIAHGYTIFADCNKNFAYDDPSVTPCNGYPEILFSENVLLETGIVICGVCSENISTIVYTPPDPKVTITPSPCLTCSSPILLRNTYGQTKTVRVNYAGLIWIE
jgi:type II secretory pathway pseudopilin PulG